MIVEFSVIQGLLAEYLAGNLLSWFEERLSGGKTCGEETERSAGNLKDSFTSKLCVNADFVPFTARSAIEKEALLSSSWAYGCQSRSLLDNRDCWENKLESKSTSMSSRTP